MTDIGDVKIRVCPECQAEISKRYPYHMLSCSQRKGRNGD